MRYVMLALAVFATALVTQAALLRSEDHITKVTADGCHSPAYQPENVLDGDPASAWVTVQENAGSGWGRHWIKVSLAQPLKLGKVTLASVQNAYASSTHLDATYELRVSLGDEEKIIGAQTVPASQKAELSDLVFDVGGQLADAITVWASWEMDREATPADRTARLRYCQIGEILIDAEVVVLKDVSISDLVYEGDAIVRAQLDGPVDANARYEVLTRLRRIGEPEALCEARKTISAAEPTFQVSTGDLSLARAGYGELAVDVALLQNGKPIFTQTALTTVRGRRLKPTAQGVPAMQPGDDLLIDDLSRFSPQDAIAPTSTPGKWWRRGYETADGVSGETLCVIGMDPDNPESWLAPELSLDPGVSGTYEIWVLMPRTYRGSGIDIKLEGDGAWQELETMMVSRYPGGPGFTPDCMVEVYWDTRELDGEKLLLRQPHGTFASFPYGFSEAHFAGVRLVKVSEQQAAKRRAQTAGEDARKVIINNDGHGIFWVWEPQEMSELYRWVDSLAGNSVDHLELCIIAGGAFNYLTEVGEVFGDSVGEDGAPRLGDKRITRSIQRFKSLGIDPLGDLLKRGREVGLPIFPSVRMDPFYGAPYAPMFNGPFWKAHPELRIPGSMHLDYAKPQVRDYYFAIFEELLAKFDVDGLSMDFTRHPPFFAGDEPEKEKYMTQFVRRVRAEADRVGEQRGKHIALSVTFHGGSYQRDGLDVAAWVKEGLLDYLCPELAPFKQPGWSDPSPFVEMVKGTDCKLFARIEHVMGGHDPTPSQNREIVPVREHRGPKDYERLMRDAVAAGLDGIYLFNQGGQWPALSRLGVTAELADRTRSDRVFGLVEGPVIRMDEPEAETEQ